MVIILNNALSYIVEYFTYSYAKGVENVKYYEN